MIEGDKKADRPPWHTSREVGPRTDGAQPDDVRPSDWGPANRPPDLVDYAAWVTAAASTFAFAAASCALSFAAFATAFS